MMRAMVQKVYGPAADVLRLRDTPMPVARPGQVLVRVRATSVHADVWHAVNGLPYVLRLMGSGVRVPKQQVPGTDLAGEVYAAGPGARFEVGDRVFGEVTGTNQWSNAGTLAEFAVADESLLSPIPADLSFEQAAAVPTAGLIALSNLVDQGHLAAGEDVLINGAAGAVGVWAVQLAKALGARVTAVDATEKLDVLRDLGADEVIDYRQQDFTELGQRYDMVFDIVSQAPLRDVRRVLNPGGRFVLVGHDQYGRAGHRVLGSLGRMLPLLAISPFVPELPGISASRPRAENMATIVDLLAARRIRPVVDARVFDLADAVAAMEYLATGVAIGRVVLRV